MKCLIVDDESLARKGLKDFIEKTPFLELASSISSAFQAIEYLRNNDIDIMFLDIQMPDMSGIELLKVISKPVKVIFTTAHREFALDGFDLNVVDYLLKPFSYGRFLQAVNKISVNSPEPLNSDDYIFIKCDGVLVKVLTDDIVVIETAKDYVYVHTVRERYLTLVSLKHIENELQSGKFLRVHRSYLAGLKHVKKLEGNLLHIGELKIRISRTNKTEVYNRIIGDRLIDRQ